MKFQFIAFVIVVGVAFYLKKSKKCQKKSKEPPKKEKKWFESIRDHCASQEYYF